MVVNESDVLYVAATR